MNLMSFRLLLFLATFSLFSTFSYSQYTDLINTNRPGVSEGAFAVGRDVIQLETGFSYGQENHRLLKTELSAFAADYSFRYGLISERLEVRWTGKFQASNIDYTAFDPIVHQNISDFKNNVIGAKYLVYDPHIKRDLKGPNLYSWRANNKFQWEDLIPAVSVFAGANLDLAENNPYLPREHASVSPKIVVATQNNFKNGLVFVTNIIADRFTDDYPSYEYILTLTHNPTELFSFFIENHGIMSDFYADQLIRGGAAALLGKDLQVDLSVTYSFKDTPTILYGRLGVAYRIDMHKTDEYLEDKDPRNEDTRESQDEKKKKKKKKKKSDEDDFHLNLDDFDLDDDYDDD